MKEGGDLLGTEAGGAANVWRTTKNANGTNLADGDLEEDENSHATTHKKSPTIAAKGGQQSSGQFPAATKKGPPGRGGELRHAVACARWRSSAGRDLGAKPMRLLPFEGEFPKLARAKAGHSAAHVIALANAASSERKECANSSTF